MVKLEFISLNPGKLKLIYYCNLISNLDKCKFLKLLKNYYILKKEGNYIGVYSFFSK